MIFFAVPCGFRRKIFVFNILSSAGIYNCRMANFWVFRRRVAAVAAETGQVAKDSAKILVNQKHIFAEKNLKNSP